MAEDAVQPKKSDMMITKIGERDPLRYRYRKSVREVHTLDEWMAAAENGLFTDPSALEDKLLRSGEAPLRDIFEEKDLRKTENLFNLNIQGNLKPTYLDAVKYIDQEYRPSGNPGEFDSDLISDDAYDVFLSAVNMFIHECNGRYDDSEGSGKLSRVFPAASLPLPQFFQAAAKFSSSEEEKEYLLGSCERFLSLLSQFPQLDSYGDTLLRCQPSGDTSCYDLTSMVNIIVCASGSKDLLEVTERDSYLYDLIILPFRSV